ncbi:SctQ family type III secretion system ring protein Spa33, partial [Shigella sonnei]
MLRIKHFDANEKLQILYAKQLCERFSIQTFKNKFTGSESLVTLTSVC